MEYEKKRVLDNTDLTGSGSKLLRLPLDFEAIRYVDHTLNGAIQTTFASGTPVCRAEGAFHQLIPTIRVLRESDAFKAVSPHFLRMQQLLSNGFAGARRSSAAAAASTNVTVDTLAMSFGTTTQYSSVEDSVRIYFELPFLKNSWEQRKTWFRTIGLSSAGIEFQQNGYSSLQSAANTAPVTYANSTLSISTEVTEVINISARDAAITGIALFKETMKTEPITGALTDKRIDVNKGNSLAAVHMYVKNAAAGSATTASDALASNIIVTNVRLWANSDRLLKQSTFKRLKDENRNRYGYLAAMASDLAPDDGYALINFVHGGLSELIDTRKGVVDSLDLVIDTTAAGTLHLKFDEVVNIPKAA